MHIFAREERWKKMDNEIHRERVELVVCVSVFCMSSKIGRSVICRVGEGVSEK